MASRLTALVFVLALAPVLATLGGCDEKPPRPGLERAVIKGKTFWLEPALDDPTRTKGLGGRASLPEGEGMLFVFKLPERLEFVMRDCAFDIDIAFLDESGRVLTTHTMKVEPRKEGESDMAYEQRLTRYSSRFAASMALEVTGGTFARLGLKPQDVVELDAAGLKARTK